ncbi:MAG TPA: DUF4350 domain-containing protein [Verrucomicrobiae bacterium]|nr:DUF4350 domain-containing protein [Verrucomicrobiae bacterium]
MKRYFPIAILLGCAALFAFGVAQLFELRFEAGDVYPPYSSLRADPLGAMAFYESLEKVSGLTVSRDFSASDRLPEKPHTAYLHLAGDRFEWDWLAPDSYKEIQKFLARDGRLVITLFPQTAPDLFQDHDDETNSVNSAKEKRMTPSRPARNKSPDQDEEASSISLEDEWGFHTDFKELEQAGDIYAPVRVVNKSGLSLPATLGWHSGIVFTNLDKSWRVIYARGTNAVVIERKFDHGSVVIATDSYFASNEAMAGDRHVDLLAWLIGPDKNVVFDEAHFGIVETSGVAVLMRKYRLHGLAAGLILLAALFIWKNATSLVPPLTDEKQGNVVAGKDSAAGFVNLLRRSIARRDVLATCFSEWKKSLAQKGTIPSARLQQAEAVFTSENSSKNSNPVETYRKISKILATRNQKL